MSFNSKSSTSGNQSSNVNRANFGGNGRNATANGSFGVQNPNRIIPTGGMQQISENQFTTNNGSQYSPATGNAGSAKSTARGNSNSSSTYLESPSSPSAGHPSSRTSSRQQALASLQSLCSRAVMESNSKFTANSFRQFFSKSVGTKVPYPLYIY